MGATRERWLRVRAGAPGVAPPTGGRCPGDSLPPPPAPAEDDQDADHGRCDARRAAVEDVAKCGPRHIVAVAAATDRGAGRAYTWAPVEFDEVRGR